MTGLVTSLMILIFSCTSGGKCVSPDVCVCNPGQFGSGCGSKCTCVNGECNAGKSETLWERVFTVFKVLDNSVS